MGVEGLTHLFPQPAALVEADLKAIGLPSARAETIRGLARAVTTGTIRFDGVIDTAAFMDKLCEIPGIGRWTAQYVSDESVAGAGWISGGRSWIVARSRF